MTPVQVGKKDASMSTHGNSLNARPRMLAAHPPTAARRRVRHRAHHIDAVRPWFCQDHTRCRMDATGQPPSRHRGSTTLVAEVARHVFGRQKVRSGRRSRRTESQIFRSPRVDSPVDAEVGEFSPLSIFDDGECRVYV